MGNSSGVIIPKPLQEAIGVTTGDPMDMAVEDGKIVLAPAVRHPRASWAEDSKALAESGEGLAWPEFGNADDEKLTW
jgi:antitoxin MazE